MNSRIFRFLALVSLTLFSIAATATTTANQRDATVRVAFMPDIHFHDIYADFSHDGFDGIPNNSSGKKATIRSMAAQLHSTRLFNENYFALLAALDDAVNSGIRYIALPGDFSDDGQPVHLKKLAQIFDQYTERYGVQFFATPGNHDPVRPFDTPGGKVDFLQADGSELSLQSPGTATCDNAKGRQSEHLVCTEGIRHLGYKGVTHVMRNTGLFPQRPYLYWETPFTQYTTESYEYHKARAAGAMEQRHYDACSPPLINSQSACTQTADTSYLVEPVEGLWLLAIDANVYEPQFANGDTPVSYSGAGNAGYNAVIKDKRYLIEWISSVVQRANAQGKRLIAFSHYPMADFYDRQAPTIAALLGDTSFQMQRLPHLTTTEQLADTGLALHVSGHMHMNDTGGYRSAAGHTLFNIQAPSLAAYPPAYKVITLLPSNQAQVKTVRINQVPRYDELFTHYRREHEYLSEHHPEKAWNRDILSAGNYNDYTQLHLRELVRLRFLPNEWPAELVQLFSDSSLDDLLTLALLPAETPLAGDASALSALTKKAVWKKAQGKAARLAHMPPAQKKSFANISGFELLVDFYLLRNGGHLALQDIDPHRLDAYQALGRFYALAALQPIQASDKHSANKQTVVYYQQSVASVLKILTGFIDSEPDDDFTLDLSDGTIVTGH